MAIEENKELDERFCVRCGLTEKEVRRDPTNGCWVMGGWYKQHSYVTQRELDKLALR